MSARTPLPWKAVTPCPGECCWHLVPADFDETNLKRENWHEYINLPEMSEADARLIAQCVNAHDALDAALREMVDSHTALYPSAEEGDEAQRKWVHRKSDAIDNARAAIAAATGQKGE